QNSLADPEFTDNFFEIVNKFHKKIREKDLERNYKDYENLIFNDKQYTTLLGTIMNICKDSSKWKDLLNDYYDGIILKSDLQILNNISNNLEILYKIYLNIINNEFKNIKDKYIYLYSGLETFDYIEDNSGKIHMLLPLNATISPYSSFINDTSNKLLKIKIKLSSRIIPIMNICMIELINKYLDVPVYMEYEVLILPNAKFKLINLINIPKHIRVVSDSLNAKSKETFKGTKFWNIINIYIIINNNILLKQEKENYLLYVILFEIIVADMNLYFSKYIKESINTLIDSIQYWKTLRYIENICSKKCIDDDVKLIIKTAVKFSIDKMTVDEEKYKMLSNYLDDIYVTYNEILFAKLSNME
ncbi:MAG: hypothetical protein QW303_07500, partial [Nitrososphaerota archaeon]